MNIIITIIVYTIIVFILLRLADRYKDAAIAERHAKERLEERIVIVKTMVLRHVSETLYNESMFIDKYHVQCQIMNVLFGLGYDCSKTIAELEVLCRTPEEDVTDESPNDIVSDLLSSVK
jgi:high-affinity nickel permease